MGYKVIVDIQLCSYTRAMPVYCSVNGCKSINDKAELNFHLFPKDEDVKKRGSNLLTRGKNGIPRRSRTSALSISTEDCIIRLVED